VLFLAIDVAQQMVQKNQ